MAIVRSGIEKHLPKAPTCPSLMDILKTMDDGQPWDSATFLSSQMAKYGFVDVEIEEVPSITAAHDASSFAHTMTTFQIPLLRKAWGQEVVEEFQAEFAPALQKYVEEVYGAGKPFEVEMVALCVEGKKA